MDDLTDEITTDQRLRSEGMKIVTLKARKGEDLRNRMTEFSVSGPYKYEHDCHQSFNVYDLGGILAAFYAFDDDLDAAQERAELFVHAILSLPPESK